MNNDTSRPQLPSDRAAEVAAVNAPTAAQNLGSKRGLKMLVRAQAASATQAPTRPVHRTASWPPTAPPEFGGEETGQQSAQSRRSPQSDLGQASSSSSHLPASALRAGPRQPLLRAPDSSDFDRLAGTSSRSSNQAPGCLSPIVSLLGTPLRPQVSVAASVRSEPALLPVSRDMGSPSACCYSILPSNIVTSAAITDQLDYLFVAFSTGAVRVYHIASGNTDREDRFGYVLYYQVSGKGGAHMGKCDVHIEIGSSTVGGLHQQASGGTSSSKHLFTAAKIGSTRMNVVDLDSLRESQRSRGFITTAGDFLLL